jgi:hypothetical protein
VDPPALAVQVTRYRSAALIGASQAESAQRGYQRHGWVKGHRLELGVCDNQQGANAAAACARGFVNDVPVMAAAGGAGWSGPRAGVLGGAGSVS